MSQGDAHSNLMPCPTRRQQDSDMDLSRRRMVTLLLPVWGTPFILETDHLEARFWGGRKSVTPLVILKNRMGTDLRPLHNYWPV